MLEWIKQQLTTQLEPNELEIIDDSRHHIGHAGNTGGGHYHVIISSDKFNGLSLIEKHRLVQTALKSEIGHGIHALQISIK